MKKMSGMILLVTLTLLSLLGITVLSYWEWVGSQYPILARVKARQIAWRKLEDTARAILSGHWPPSCGHQPHNVSSNFPCTLVSSGELYHFRVDALGTFSCVQIRYRGETFGTQHWRLRMVGPAPNPAGIEWRFATRVPTTPCRDSQIVRILSNGILSWHHWP